MPFNKADILCMSNELAEYVNKEQIVTQFGVKMRTVERLIEEYNKKIKKNRRWRGNRYEYYWPNVLWCVKLHTGIAQENIPSTTIKKKYTKQRIIELEEQLEELKKNGRD